MLQPETEVPSKRSGAVGVHMQSAATARVVCLSAAVMLAAIGTVTAPLARPAVAQPASPRGVCTAQDRQAALSNERQRVLDYLGDLTTMRNPLDAARLALKGWGALPHGFISFAGNGMPVGRLDAPLTETPLLVPLVGEPVIRTDMPDLLFYRPTTTVNVSDPFFADFPYTLLGWAYIDVYSLEHDPTRRGPDCLERSDWFVHERGIHDLPFLGFFPVPPRERFQGEASGRDLIPPLVLLLHPGLPHPRSWVTHLWLNPDATLTPSFANPHVSVPGADPHFGQWFFYPPSP